MKDLGALAYSDLYINKEERTKIDARMGYVHIPKTPHPGDGTARGNSTTIHRPAVEAESLYGAIEHSLYIICDFCVCEGVLERLSAVGGVIRFHARRREVRFALR